LSDLIGEPVVAVRLNIVELKQDMEFSDIPIDFDITAGMQTEAIYQLLPPTVTIKAEIPQSLAQATNNIRTLFHAKISPATLQAGSTELKVLVEAPLMIKILAITPETVTLKISQTRPLKIKP
jgi:hypothetical protein